MLRTGTASILRFILLVSNFSGLMQCAAPSEQEELAARKQYYTQALQELHKIECDHLVRFNIDIPDTDVYTFRSKAFQAVLKDPDRKMLAKYEDLYQALATLEYTMTPDERVAYDEVVRDTYRSRCK